MGASVSKSTRHNKVTHVKLKNHMDNEMVLDSLHAKSDQTVTCTHGRCKGAIVNNVTRIPGKIRSKDEVISQAKEFCDTYYASIEKQNSQEHMQRWKDIMKSVKSKGTYDLTVDELSYGAKMAWRNAPRCIGRMQWTTLKMFDARDAKTPKDMFDAICRHISYGTNNGNIRSAMTVFPARTDGKHDFRLWNYQFIRYAGYLQPDGTVIGDPASVEFTEICKKLGWKPKGTMFDVLPMVLSANGGDPEVFEIPSDIVLEVELKHPKFKWFEEFGLRWYVLPAVGNMMFDCGGIEFPAAPFNGWYMCTEVGARNLCDDYRFNISEIVATKMGLDTSTPTSFWKDKAIVEVNHAVLHSFQTNGVTMVDHHSASESFMKFMMDEQRTRGGCPADWVWIVPPISGSATPVFHQEMLMYKVRPYLDYQANAWETHTWKNTSLREKFAKKKRKFKSIARAVFLAASLMKIASDKRSNCTIVYATVTGKSETFARTLGKIFSHAFNVKVLSMDKYNIQNLQKEECLLLVACTFGNGDPPDSGMEFTRELKDREANGTYKLAKTKYAVFGLGSRAYTKFCGFAHFLDKSMAVLGANRIVNIGEGDELSGQENAFSSWARNAFQESMKIFKITGKGIMEQAMKVLEYSDLSWEPGKFRLASVNDKSSTLIEALSFLHNKQVIACKQNERKQLQSKGSSRQTILLGLSAVGNEKLEYKPGDHLSTFPANNSNMVDKILSRLRSTLPSDQTVKVERVDKKTSVGGVKHWIPYEKMPVCTVRMALKYLIDITTPPTPTVLHWLASFATDKKDQDAIMTLSNDSNLYDKWRYDNYPSLVDILEEYPSLEPEPEFLMTQFPELKERFYSISSSADTLNGKVQLTVGVMKYSTVSGKEHEGVCSTYLAQCSNKEIIPCYTRSAVAFHMPEDTSLPIVMVGAGTGIAPFRGFWQQRKYQKQKNGNENYGDMYLYFGCRQSTVDNIYSAELKTAEKDGIISKVFYAFSREPGQNKKTYVQHMMANSGNLLYEAIFTKGGHFYVCGETQMATDVGQTLCDIVQKSGNKSAEDAQAEIDHLHDTNRYHEDLFGPIIRSVEQ